VLSGSYYAALEPGLLGEIYGIQTDEGLIIIDAGLPDSGLAQIRETCAYYGLGEKIAYLIITHVHNDHAGNARAIQDMGAKVIVGAGDLASCLNGGFKDTPFDVEQVFPAFIPDITIDKDTELDLCGVKARFFTIPGHSNGSIALQFELDERVFLCTGDALQPAGNGVIEEVSFGWQGDVNFSRANIVKSMMKLAKLNADVILPGHGKICLKNGTALLQLAARQAFMTMR
jgi:glyoxylase-like metal-dependent hydrolase (beta-lactamase superfamily II)